MIGGISLFTQLASETQVQTKYSVYSISMLIHGVHKPMTITAGFAVYFVASLKSVRHVAEGVDDLRDRCQINCSAASCKGSDKLSDMPSGIWLGLYV